MSGAPPVGLKAKVQDTLPGSRHRDNRPGGRTARPHDRTTARPHDRTEENK
ncbi:hypothetical protein [Streptomyces sp. yara]|uniref:hypothetical protein n=1 Tax=Streptomyces sp. yara TaxID=3458421 RepID=UPI00403FE90E